MVRKTRNEYLGALGAKRPLDFLQPILIERNTDPRSENTMKRLQGNFVFLAESASQGQDSGVLLFPLQGSRAEQKIHDVSFVRLQPIELRGGNRAEIQAVDVRRVHKRLL